MECRRIPPAQTWDRAQPEELLEFRIHLSNCSACYKRVLYEAPDQLLFHLNQRDLPSGFWLGFWNSLQKKIFQDYSPPTATLRCVRWAAVVIFGLLLVLYGRSFQEPPETVQLMIERKQYPILEDIQDPATIYYLLEPAENSKIVFIFNPDMDL